LLDLNLYSSGTAVQTFTSGSAAFNTGTEVINLSTFIADLPALNSSGSIYAGNSSGPGNGTAIGSWRVATVPEPTTLALAGLGVLGCVLMFWRRKS
jgi:hypothetical protein